MKIKQNLVKAGTIAIAFVGTALLSSCVFDTGYDGYYSSYGYGYTTYPAVSYGYYSSPYYYGSGRYYRRGYYY